MAIINGVRNTNICQIDLFLRIEDSFLIERFAEFLTTNFRNT